MKRFISMFLITVCFLNLGFASTSVLGDDMLIRFKADKVTQGENLDFIMDVRKSEVYIQSKGIPSGVTALTVYIMQEGNENTYTFPIKTKGENGYGISNTKFSDFRKVISSGKSVAIIVRNSKDIYVKALLNLNTETFCQQMTKAGNIVETKIGTKGPAGGWIFYDCDEDNDFGNADGLISSVCGWRYLEAAPADVRLVSGKPSCDTTDMWYDLSDASYMWGDDGSFGTKTEVGKGNYNTRLIVKKTKKRIPNAAKLCDELVYNGYSDWFLPSKDELNRMYQNLKKKGVGNFANYFYWSSSEDNDYSNDAWGRLFGSGYQDYHTRGYYGCVRAIRAF